MELNQSYRSCPAQTKQANCQERYKFGIIAPGARARIIEIKEFSRQSRLTKNKS